MHQSINHQLLVSLLFTTGCIRPGGSGWVVVMDSGIADTLSAKKRLVELTKSLLLASFGTF